MSDVQGNLMHKLKTDSPLLSIVLVTLHLIWHLNLYLNTKNANKLKYSWYMKTDEK